MPPVMAAGYLRTPYDAMPSLCPARIQRRYGRHFLLASISYPLPFGIRHWLWSIHRGSECDVLRDCAICERPDIFALRMTPRPQDMDAISSWQASATPCRLVFATDYGLSIAAVNVTFSVIVQYASDRISSHSVWRLVPKIWTPFPLGKHQLPPAVWCSPLTMVYPSRQWMWRSPYIHVHPLVGQK